jgi:hypothetical protein
VERFHQTEKKFLKAKARSRSIPALQERLDVFSEYYNVVRPHRAKRRRTPQAAFDERVKAQPSGLPIRDAGEFRIRFDRVNNGKVTLRYEGKLRHLGIGRAHNGKRVVLLVDDRDVRVHSVHGKFLRELHIDPDKIYQGQSA